MMVECFARRIMAPFQGVLQVIRVGAGEAESTDGRNWVLYAAHPEVAEPYVTHPVVAKAKERALEKLDGVGAVLIAGGEAERSKRAAKRAGSLQLARSFSTGVAAGSLHGASVKATEFEWQRRNRQTRCL